MRTRQEIPTSKLFSRILLKIKAFPQARLNRSHTLNKNER